MLRANSSNTSASVLAPVLVRVDDRQILLGEQYLLQLLGRVDAELVPGQSVDLGFQFRNAAAELPAQFGQAGHVDLDAVVLHVRQHVDQRQLQLFEQLGKLRFGQPGL